MDPLCHTLAGAALGDAGLKQRTTLGMATLLIASNVPDIDIAVLATDTLAVSFRRGWTHGVLSMAVLPAVLAGVMLAWDRFFRRSESPPANVVGLLLLSYIGAWLHVFMDFLNSYGVRLLMPFSNRWFYGDALYIIDPILYILLGSSVLVGRAREAHWPSRVGLLVAGSYVVLMLLSNGWARAEVRDGLSRAGQPSDTRFMVTPVFANPFRREVILDVGDRYEKGFLWFELWPHFRPAGYGVDTNRSNTLVQQVLQTPRIQAYLRWSRFPFFIIERTDSRPRVRLNDYRYSGPSGWGWAALTTDVP